MATVNISGYQHSSKGHIPVRDFQYLYTWFSLTPLPQSKGDFI